MLYDGDCKFCFRWILKWQKITGEKIIYKPYQMGLADFPQLTKEQCTRAVQLITPEEEIFSGAHAAFKAFVLAGRYKWLLRLYEHSLLFARICEFVYQWVSHRRSLLSKFKE